MAHFYRYDTPGTLPVSSSSLPSFADFDDATAELTAPDDSTEAIAAVLADGDLTVDIPILDQAGVYTLRVSVTGPGVSRALEPLRIPVEEIDAAWHTIDSARREWDGAPQDDARLYSLLETARTQCLAYAPATTTIPPHYRAAQVLQARNIWNASRIDPGASQMNADGYTVPVFPLDWTVRQLLRPIQGRPVVA